MDNSKKLKLWMYWENLPGTRMPSYIKMCHEVAVKNCPACEVVLVTPEALHSYLPDIPFDLGEIHLNSEFAPPVALKADYIRAALLEKFGGVWLDIDCLVLVDLGPYIQKILAEYDFCAVRKTETTDNVSNGFMASRPQGIVISQYLAAMTSRIRENLARGKGFDWSEIGTKLLTPIALAHSDICYFEPEKNVHPIHYKDSDIFWRRNDCLNLHNIIASEVKIVTLYNARFTDDQKRYTRWQLLNCNSLLGALMRKVLPEQTRTAGLNKPAKQHYHYSDVEIIFTTVARPQLCLAFVKSVREQLGNAIGIHFTAQGQEEPEYAAAEQDYGCKVTRVDEDYGLGASRNLLIESAERPLIFLCDDDMLFDDRLQLQKALDVMSVRRDIGVLGGMLENYTYDESGNLTGGPTITCFNHLTWRDGDTLKYLPVEYTDLPREFIDPCSYIRRMDTVNNLALFRLEIFEDLALRWDPQCKITGEHEKFYADFHATAGDKFKIYYTNLLVAQHHRHTNPLFSRLRKRNTGLTAAMTALHARQLLFYGKRNEFLQQDHTVHRSGHLFWSLP